MKNKLISTFAKVKIKVVKHSPEILTTVGVVGVVTSAVMACKATRKLDGILETAKDDVEKIKDLSTDSGMVDYTAEDGQKDLAITYVQTGAKIVKLYLPSIALGVVSLTCMLSANKILQKRNAALSAAYFVLDKSFKEYKGRVVERFGEEVEKEIRYNIRKSTEGETYTDKDGNVIDLPADEKVIDALEYSEYARFFDEGSIYWKRDSEYNMVFLKSQQQYCNDLLISRGHLFLNEVYDMLGIPRTKAGQVVGWIYDTKTPVGDNYVDFGIYDMDKERVRAFINGYEQNILLDFNVDGVVLDLL